MTTEWSLISKAADPSSDQSQESLQTLCINYWLPLYAYARRRMDLEKAKDMTQEFFCVLLDKDYLKTADQNKGRFRAFLLTAFKNFLANQHDRETAIKRGGRNNLLSLDFKTADSHYPVRAVNNETPEKVFERQWVLTLLENVLSRMREYYRNKGTKQLATFEELKSLITGASRTNYAELSKQLQVSPESLRVKVHRMREKYREALRAEIGATVSSPEEVDDEIKRLFEIMA